MWVWGGFLVGRGMAVLGERGVWWGVGGWGFVEGVWQLALRLMLGIGGGSWALGAGAEAKTQDGTEPVPGARAGTQQGVYLKLPLLK